MKSFFSHNKVFDIHVPVYCCGKCRCRFTVRLIIVIAMIYGMAYGAQVTRASRQPAGSPTATKTNVVTTNVPVVIEIPKAVFIWNPKEQGFGRDPFFPPKPKISGTIATNQATIIQSVDTKPEPSPKPKLELVLNGLIGKVACIINGKQITAGSVEMVPCAGGKVKVRCDKIENNSAFITIFLDDGSTEVRELALKSRM